MDRPAMRRGRPDELQHRIGRVIRISKSLRIPKQRFGMGEEMVAHRDRLRPLEMCVARHHPVRVPARLGGQRFDRFSER